MKTPYTYNRLLSPPYRAARKVFRKAWHFGNSIHCPICDQSFRSWVTNGTECPNCGSAPRHRLLWLYMNYYCSSIDSFDIELGQTLHFAAEPCLSIPLRKELKDKYQTCDLSAPGMDLYYDITNLNGIRNNQFDTIINIHVLEHIADDHAAMSEMYRVLKPGGRAFIMVPYNRDRLTHEDPTITDPKKRKELWDQEDHLRAYGTDFTDRLELVGFDVKEVFFTETLSDVSMKRYGLWTDVIFVARKY